MFFRIVFHMIGIILHFIAWILAWICANLDGLGLILWFKSKNSEFNLGLVPKWKSPD